MAPVTLFIRVVRTMETRFHWVDYCPVIQVSTSWWFDIQLRLLFGYLDTVNIAVL